MVIDFGVDGGRREILTSKNISMLILSALSISPSTYTILAMRIELHNVGLFIEFIEFYGFFLALGI